MGAEEISVPLTNPHAELVQDAIEAAAGADDAAISESFGRRNVSRRRLGSARTVVVRFLENLPEDLTVLDLRQAIEGEVGDD